MRTICTLIAAIGCVYTLYAQRSTLVIPRDRPVDSVFLDIYRLDYPDPANDPYGIGYTRQFGWLVPSAKFDTDSFYQWTKQTCMDRVGADFFYTHFRLSRTSFKENRASEVYTITYFFAPFADSILQADDDLYIGFSFKHYDFLGRSETQIPANLPNCLVDPTLCEFPYDRAKVLAITRERVIGDHQVLSAPYLQLRPDFTWEVSVDLGEAGIKHFSVDCRTGVMSAVQTGWRID